MKEIKVGSRVKTLFRTGPYAGLEGKVTKIERPGEDVKLPEGFMYMGTEFPTIHFDVDGKVYSGPSYTLECLDPDVPEWTKVGLKDLMPGELVRTTYRHGSVFTDKVETIINDKIGLRALDASGATIVSISALGTSIIAVEALRG